MKNAIRKMIAIMATLIILTIIIISWMATRVEEKLRSRDERTQAIIGKSYIINNDTVQVVDYSFFESSFTLSNGVEISEKYALTLKPIK